MPSGICLTEESRLGIPLVRFACEFGACAPGFPSRSHGSFAADSKRLPGTATPRRSTPGALAIILLTANGVGTNDIMRRTGRSKTCIWRWQAWFMEGGLGGLLRDKTWPSRIAPLGPEVAQRVAALTLTDPPAETTHWTAHLMARTSGTSASAVRRIWKPHGLQPHCYRRQVLE